MSLAELVLSLALQRASSATPRALLGLDASAPMITVARSTATAEGIAIEWWEANAVELPFPEAAFDVVLCQSGLQFFPDRSASLREMRRVLKPGGRLILSVWGPIERSRGFAVAADAVARHIGPEAARPITLAFDLMTAQSRGLSVVSQPTNRVPRVCGHAERSISDDEPN